MTTHTPGPWEEYKGIVSAENGSVFSIADCRNAFVGSNWSGTDFATRSHRDANARLIAAAPLLLEALKDLLAYHSQPTGFDTAVCMDDKQFGEFLKGITANGDELAAKARAAIAKATGA
ncbi:hypothetical protein [Achromobacter sp. ACRQX]|uniref:hypothetical protein n=1 Tax=Achromobacter sp. ACRQX TaxID=2918181 RepID=UPI001EF2A620|nr:hypothetical protein [Achromobacter sp. ACRQX]MCG7328029.1 hypothetical protein [Achromobacter sp. ACRQX]